MMTITRATTPWLSALALVLSGCLDGKPSGNTSLTAVTPQTHEWFPLGAGASHELGKVTRDGTITCESCHPPAAASFKDIDCVSCHTHAQSVMGRVHGSVKDYGWTSAQCWTCHPKGEEVPYDHAGITDNCKECHDVGAPFAALPVPGFSHLDTAGADCAMCHVTTTWKGATGMPPGDTSDPQKDVTVTGLIPRYAGTSIVSLSPQAQGLKMVMNHQTTAIPAAALSACTNCHADAAAGVLYPGLLHSSLANLNLGEPSTCGDCHRAAAMPEGFVGPLDPARYPRSGAMKHDAVAWTGGAPGTTALVTQDCGVCHRASSGTVDATWASAKGAAGVARYHSALASASKAQPGSCVDCHANSRPTALLTHANAPSLPAGLSFDHASASALGDCQDCHAASLAAAPYAWGQGRFHVASTPAPSTCLPCHADERPTSDTGWVSTTYKQKPFDYGTNPEGITHGDGEDCALCHAAPAPTATPSWVGGHFSHGPQTVASTTCIACHSTQRPDLQPNTTPAAMKAALGVDHALDAAGECFACHQATVTRGAYASWASPPAKDASDWRGGVGYPGDVFVSSATQFVTVKAWRLTRATTGGKVTGTTTTTSTLYNGMLHTSSVIPVELRASLPDGGVDPGSCWHCHTSTGTTVMAFKDGKYHQALTSYSATPGGTPAPLPQPSAQCGDCHAKMLPTVGIVQKTDAGSNVDLFPMDHNALFTGSVTFGGVPAAGVADVDCSVCHQKSGGSWADGVFHANLGTAVPANCVDCHYPLMANAAKADLAGATASKMAHRSAQVVNQACEVCHAQALAKSKTAPTAATQWKPGALHGALTAQPTACLDCHLASEPAANASTQSSVVWAFAKGGTTTNGAQWMNHGSATVVGKDCVVCHAADAKPSGAAWSKASVFHRPGAAISTCRECHGLTNGGGSVVGTKNNLPAGLTDSDTQTTAALDPTTGVAAGTLDQISHADLNASGKDCAPCHAQAGVSLDGGAGTEWKKASFHQNFTAASPLVMNDTTGRCSTCHLNVKPGPTFTTFDHAGLTAVSGSADCAMCHSFPGTGTVAAPNWKGGAAMPAYLSVGGFTIPVPPAATAGTLQQGIANLPHPTVAAGTACTTCHAQAQGGKLAKGYDHASPLINSNCNACHEAGSNLVAVTWSTTTHGDTRPTTRISVDGTLCSPVHFFPTDCKECHRKPAGNGVWTSGGAATTAWRFAHSEGAPMTRPATCNKCHGSVASGGCGIPD